MRPYMALVKVEGHSKFAEEHWQENHFIIGKMRFQTVAVALIFTTKSIALWQNR